MFLTGIGIPVMAALNAGLGKGLASPTAATAVLYLVGLAMALAALAWTGQPDWSRAASIPLPNWFGAFFVVAYILAVTWFAPRIGVGNAVFFVLIGQLLSAAAIDHFGLLGAERMTISPQRALGLLVMAAGVWLAKKPT
jgi:transporter family-2 protein